MRSSLPISLAETQPVQATRLSFPWMGITLLYVLGIASVELLTTIYDPVTGIIGHGLLLVMLFFHCVARRDIYTQRMLVTLSLVPLSRLISLSIPSNNYSLSIFYLLVGIQLLIAAALALRYTGHTLVYLMYIEPSFSGIATQVFIGLCGIGLGYVEFLILRPQPLVDAYTIQQVWLPALILLIFTGFLEELIFRGLMQKSFVDRMGRYSGVVLVSLIYAVLNIGHYSALNVLFVFVVALFFGYAVLRTRSIVGVSLAHGITNVFLFLIFPFFLS